jgi:hypothetical protein
LEHHVPPELNQLFSVYEQILNFSEKEYAAVILSLSQRLAGIDDEIKAVTITGTSVAGRKFTIIIRER